MEIPATGLVLIGIFSIPSVLSLTSRPRRRERKEGVYRDEDGKATPDSVKAYSTGLPKAFILISAATGCALSVGSVLLASGREGVLVEDWLSAAAWMALVFQAVAIASSRKCTQAYGLGIYTFLSALILAGLVLDGTKIGQVLLHRHRTLFALRVVEVGSALVLAASGLAIPRRPAVFHDGEMVDALYTTTAYSRFTWTWPTHLLQLAHRKRDLDLADLPRPDHYTRSAAVSSDWKGRDSRHRLWLSLILAHKGAFALQWVLTLCSSILNFAPQWCLLQLLVGLESREAGGEAEEEDELQMWMWVVWLGVSIMAMSWVESYTFWLSWAELAIPIRAQLSALIFEKSLRKKDVKGAAKSTKPAEAGDLAEPTEPTAPGQVPAASSGGEDNAVEKDGNGLEKSKQSTVNLMGVDTKRISDFCSYQNFFPQSLFKLAVSLVFLIKLLGWMPLFSGLSAMVLVMPVNVFFSKRYAAAQGRLMKVRDAKMAVVTEALQGIRQIKFSALEGEWERKVGEVREKELGCVWDVYMADTFLLACWITSPILLSAISLAVYAAINGALSPSVAFVSLSVFKALEVTLSVVPELTTDLLDAWVSLKRVEEYMKSAEVSRMAEEAEEVAFENASIAWPSDRKGDGKGDGNANRQDEHEHGFVLRHVSLTFPRGQLSVISGKTGTGKSLMLSAILGEVDLLAGKLYLPKPPSLADRDDNRATKANWIIPEAIAYVSQTPWMENASIRDNIIFGLPFVEERYKETIQACALTKDLHMFADGERTEIGANGVNLSGGQKWRVTLARAIYSRAGILLLDDIFSAVDSQVGRHILEKCLDGVLAKGRTRILVTHHLSLCEPKTKYLVELGDGRVQQAGLVAKLREEGTLQGSTSDEAPAAVAAGAEEGGEGKEGEEEEGREESRLKKVTCKSQVRRKFVEDERREQGAVRKQIYATYLRDSGGLSFWIFALFVFAAVQVVTVERSWWLRIWTGDHEQTVFNRTITNTGTSADTYGYGYAAAIPHMPTHPLPRLSLQERRHSTLYYLGIYLALAVGSALIGTLRFLYIYTGSVAASRKLFSKLNFVILRAPIRRLDTLPLGRILNRFTSDFNIIDSQLANSIGFGANAFLGLLAVVAAGLFVSPYMVLLAGILLVVCLYYGLLYLDAARPVKRLESTTKSPVFDQFASALSGLATIRAFDKSQAYMEQIYRKLDDYSTASWHLWLFNRWMGWRMALAGSFFASFVAIVILLTPDIDSALAGFALAFALEFSGCFMWTIRLYATVELNMNAAERIIEYTELPTESLDGQRPPAAWPTEGRIEVEDLVVAYADDLAPVLTGLNFSVERNERIGVVGRTGAGKSSLTLAIFRFLEPRSGSIRIDGLDISRINLHDLRSRLAIIPQDPVLFSGTIRSNLDPFAHNTDAALRDCLERVHLSVDLDLPTSEGGLNFSQGQRQLLCLARAIVSRPRVMVLDEATSAVDMHTDALIQRSIRDEFTDTTLLVIAHRLSTIADLDRILVLSDGKVAEFGSPVELWEKGGDGMFRSMCEGSGERDRLRELVYQAS